MTNVVHVESKIGGGGRDGVDYVLLGHFLVGHVHGAGSVVPRPSQSPDDNLWDALDKRVRSAAAPSRR